ncbi:glycosyltransferase family 2 protein [Egicoccus halophilus]|uniref:Glycosyl transferase family 2 n=1 Tax=Egicoccus halophilus TaxID=1670830 RepID=A0A8J3AEZ4_9ACTN|nr:glycosyltransferase [Egicoccus halophilus]GGI06188.1 glycosyl transferase family 2 [Egicoccus halophilus]
MAIRILESVLTATALAALVYFLLVNGTYSLQLLLAGRELKQRRRRLDLATLSWWHRTPDAPRLSVLAPAYNESVTIVDAVEGMLTLEYPDLEVVVVNDGSPDDTLPRLVDAFELVPDPYAPSASGVLPTRPVRTVYRSRTHSNLVVVDKDNGGKADALNAGIGVASGDLFVALDADTIVAPDALLRMARAFLETSGNVAVGGTIQPINGDEVRDGRVVNKAVDRRWFGGVQSVEYVRAFFIGRLGWNRLGGNVIISGAFGAFHRPTAVAVGGYRHDSIGEDFELVVRMRRHGYDTGGPHRVQFLPDPVAYTETPVTHRVLRNQRIRWHRGLLDTLWTHRDAIFRPRYRGMAFGGLGFFTLVEAVGPIVEALGLLALLIGLPFGLIDVEFALLYFVLAYLWGVALSIGSLAVEDRSTASELRVRDRVWQLVAAVSEPLWFRQLSLFWRLEGTWRWLRRDERTWGTMTRTGFGTQRPTRA